MFLIKWPVSVSLWELRWISVVVNLTVITGACAVLCPI